MRLKDTEPLWRILSRARLERLDLPAISPLVYACKIRALSKAIPPELRNVDEIRAWLEAEAVRSEQGHD